MISKPAPATTASSVGAPNLGHTVLLKPRTKTSGCNLRALPDRRCSPGAYYSGLTKAVICSPSFRTGPIRSVPDSEKHAIESEYGLVPKSYGRTLEIDHIVSLELGGSNDVANLFPEKASLPDHQPGYHLKDKLENAAHDAVCAGQLSLRYVQMQIASNWELLYKKIFGVAPTGWMDSATAMRQLGWRSEERAARLQRWFEIPMFVAALLLIPVIVIEETHVDHSLKLLGSVLNWAIWIAFAAELLVMLAVVPDRARWLRTHPLEVGIVVLTPPVLPASLQALRFFRLLRILRLSAVLKRYRSLFSMDGIRGAAVVAVIAALGGGALFSEVEKSYSVWDGVWFALTTMTTVGYGDLSPHTTGGRLIAAALMLIGIGFVALLTGAIAQRFLTPQIAEVEEIASDVEADVLDVRDKLASELCAISARLQELEQLVQRLDTEK